MDVENIEEEIRRLKEEKNAIILAHNYQRGEIQDIADLLGDSLGLSMEVAKTDADMIVFCGVSFMAETAKILSPDKKVLQPSLGAGCELANKITAQDVKVLKQKYPDARVVSYVNTTADVKAESDVCCTSANAVNVVRNIESDRVIFIPDRNLASFVRSSVDKEVIPWDGGYCYVHENITKEEVLKAREKYPDALLLVHPECNPSVIYEADEVLSTGGMVGFVKGSVGRRFLIGTEEGIIYRLQKENPGKEFYPVGDKKVCWDMKMTTLKDVYLCLLDERYEISLPEGIIDSAKRALEAMLRYT
jgi:quinolinate synthase